MYRKTILIVAINLGPYQTVQALESAMTDTRVLYLVEGPARVHRKSNGLHFYDLSDIKSKWCTIEHFLRDSGVTNIIRSSSETSNKLNLEILTSISANKLNIPVYVIEDFPGNYHHIYEEHIERLFIEQESLIALHEGRGVDPSIIKVVSNPRYHNMLKYDVAQYRKQGISNLQLGPEPHIMWCGQPDCSNSFKTLSRIIEYYNTKEVTILFRAHPQDDLYNSGYYGPLLNNSSINIIDVSTYDNIIELYCASKIVMTQFSSTAVEASYLGIPAVFVLFRDIGKPYLKRLKGYDTIPYTLNECSFHIELEEDIQTTLDNAIYDETYRDIILNNFNDHYGNLANGVTCIIEAINGDSNITTATQSGNKPSGIISQPDAFNKM